MSHQCYLELPYFNKLTNCNENAFKWALSFCGCGFLGAYHIGVLACIREKHPKLMNHVSRIYGSSVGTIIGAVIICGIESNNAFDFLHNIAKITLENSFGIFSLSCDICEIIRNNLAKELPENIHQIASHKLFVNVTCFPSMKPMIISNFESKTDFIDICMDGGLSDNQPTPERYSFSELFKLINISPFIGEGDIAPKSSHDYCDNAISIANQHFILTFNNVKRLIEGLSPQSASTTIGFARQGYNDTESYLRRRCEYIQRCIYYNDLNELEDFAVENAPTSLFQRLIHFPLMPFKCLARFYMNGATFLLYILCLSGNMLHYPTSKVVGIFGISSYIKMLFNQQKE